MWFYCCDHLPPSLFTVTTDLNVESSRTFAGGKKRATFNTDLSPFESAQRYFVPNGRSMLSSLGKKWSWVRLLWRLWDHHRAVNEPRWRKRLDQEGVGRGGAGWQGEAKSYQREAEANDNDKWTTMAQDCWPEGGLTIKTSTESWKRLTVLNWSCILRGNLIFQVFCFLKNMYTNIINKKRIVGQNLSAGKKTKSAILKTLKNSIRILYVRLVLFERNKTS